jgi:hypothetical protein
MEINFVTNVQINLSAAFSWSLNVIGTHYFMISAENKFTRYK